jgi:hypothetical protein
MLRSLVVSTALVAISLGCASTGSGPGEVRRSQVLTQEEIASSGVSGNAFDVVTRLRPNFLASRGPTTLGNAQTKGMYPNIYLDDIPYGDINTLRNIDASVIAEIRLYQAGEAQTKFGMGNSGGVIAITTRR